MTFESRSSVRRRGDAKGRVTVMASSYFAVVFLLLVVSSCSPALAQTTTCGCDNCTAAIFATDAEGDTCQARIDERLLSGSNETEACALASEKYPLTCGPYWYVLRTTYL